MKTHAPNEMNRSSLIFSEALFDGYAGISFWILNGRGKQVLRVNPAPRFVVAGLNESGSGIRRKALKTNEFLFEWKTSVAVSALGETGRLSETPVLKFMNILFSRNRENGKNVKIGLPFTENSLFTTT